MQQIYNSSTRFFDRLKWSRDINYLQVVFDYTWIYHLAFYMLVGSIIGSIIKYTTLPFFDLIGRFRMCRLWVGYELRGNAYLLSIFSINQFNAVSHVIVW